MREARGPAKVFERRASEGYHPQAPGAEDDRYLAVQGICRGNMRLGHRSDTCIPCAGPAGGQRYLPPWQIIIPTGLDTRILRDDGSKSPSGSGGPRVRLASR